MQPYTSFCLCFSSLASPKRRHQAGPACLLQVLPGGKRNLGAHLQEAMVFPFLGHPFLSTLPWNSLPMFFFMSAATTVTPLLCYFLWLSIAAPLGPAGWSPSPWSLPLPDCMCVCVWVIPDAGVRQERALCFSPSCPLKKINYSVPLREMSFVPEPHQPGVGQAC